MRVWDIHPGYLSRQSLLGQHAEIHALYSVITGGGKGYASHPETLRWEKHTDLLRARHDLTVKEMRLRGFKHTSPMGTPGEGSPEKLKYVDPPGRQLALLKEKYARKDQQGRIPLPQKGSAFWAHYEYSIMGRGLLYHGEMQQFLRGRKDYPVEEDHELIQKIFAYMEYQPTDKSWRNLINHLWGCFNYISSAAEREAFGDLIKKTPSGAQMDYLYSLAEKYNQQHLLYSTVFADFASGDF